MLDDIRKLGWNVAVHNDYWLGEIFHTFWLFTKDGYAVKGEGTTDDEALRQVYNQVMSPREDRVQQFVSLVKEYHKAYGEDLQPANRVMAKIREFLYDWRPIRRPSVAQEWTFSMLQKHPTEALKLINKLLAWRLIGGENLRQIADGDVAGRKELIAYIQDVSPKKALIALTEYCQATRAQAVREALLLTDKDLF